MNGSVSQRHAILPISLRTARGNVTIDFVIDTGFTGYLTLPEAAVFAMGLAFVEEILANLATDAQVYLPVHSATILWNGAEREVGVLATGKRPLLGTALLSEHELLIQFRNGGLVQVDELQP